MPTKNHYEVKTDTSAYTIELNSEDNVDPPGAHEFYQGVGRVVIQWGRVENNIDVILRMIMDLPESLPVRPKKGAAPSQQFTGKVEIWRKAFTSLPSLQPMRDEGLSIIDGAEGWERYRTSLVHSLWGDFDHGPPLKLKGIKVAYRKGQHHVEQSVVELIALHELAQRLSELIKRTVAMCHHVNDLRKAANVHPKGVTA